MNPTSEMWQDEDDCELPSQKKYTPSVSATIIAPGKARVNEIFGMLYSTLNSVQRLVHMAVDASDGLVSEDEAKKQLSAMERWVEQSTETMKEQSTAIDNLKKMLDIYEKSVWVKTQELSEAHNQNGNNDVGSREAIINALQEQLSEMEARYDNSEVKRVEQCFKKLYTDGCTQTFDSFPTTRDTNSDEDDSEYTDDTPRVNKRAKINPRHPMFLKLKCLECKMPMSKKRWLALPKPTQRQLAFLQIEVDRFIKNKQKEVSELLPENCLGCEDLKKVQEVTLPLKASNYKLSTVREKTEENIFSIDMSQIKSRTSESEEFQSGQMSQRSSIIVAPAMKKNLLKRGFQKLRKRENTLSGDTTLMVRLAVLNKLRERGVAVDVSVCKEPNQKLGLRIKNNLCIEGYDRNSLAEKMSHNFPVGHFIVAIDCNPVEKLGPVFSKLMSPQQLTVTVSDTAFSPDPQQQLNGLLMGDAAVARSSISLTEPLQFSDLAEEEGDQSDGNDDHEEAVMDPLSGVGTERSLPSQQSEEVPKLRQVKEQVEEFKETEEVPKKEEVEEEEEEIDQSSSEPATGSEPQPSETSTANNQPPPSLSAPPSVSIRSSLSSINVTPRLGSTDRVPGNTPQKSGIKDTASSWFNKLVKKPSSSSSTSPSNPSSNYVASRLHIDAFPDT